MSDIEEKPALLSDKVPLTPMLTQYLDLKKKYPDAILFYRMGDFYEMFFEDALKAAPVLEVQLTSRDRSAANPIPMCGVPHHAVSGYLQKLVNKGFKVALCEQMEDPAAAKGIVRRDVTRVVTPALVGDPDLVPEETTNLLIAISEDPKREGEIEIAVLDLLGSQLKIGKASAATILVDLLLQLNPKEVLYSADAEKKKWFVELHRMFPNLLYTERGEYFYAKNKLAPAHAALLLYIKETQKISDLSHLGDALPLFEADAVQMDHTTIASLEILRNGTTRLEEATLFDILNRTVTPMGRRTLRNWLTRPLCDITRIKQRQAAVDCLFKEVSFSSALREQISHIRDLERLSTKTALGLAMPRDIVAIREILKLIPSLKLLLKASDSPLLKKHGKKLAELTKIRNLLESALDDIAPATLRDGGIFRSRYRPDIAELRALSTDAKTTIAAIETREKNRTGISSLKVRYSKVFGYTIEITKSYLDRVPPEYIRKQTIANAERFITPELKDFEEKVITADHKLKTLEEGLFLEIRAQVSEVASELLINSKVLGELDVLLSFARVARERGYVRPEMHDGFELTIEDGRHPVVEALLPPGQFVPNAIHFSDEDCRTLIITGPNMGGKSTIMRQTALLTLMAHVGSFIPARSAKIPLVDAIFTRIGSSDDLSRGRSTFMVEMIEVARILEQATPRSLIIIDEIGRGTSTYDGLSLAWSLLEYIHKDVGAKTLFATHFHELTNLEKSLPQLKNANVLVQKWKDEVVFLYKLVDGICNQSYGIEVARLAGLPPTVLTRAKNILGVLESLSQKGNRDRSRALTFPDNQMVFFDELKSPENRPDTGV